MRLVVSQYSQDEQSSLDCIFCLEERQGEQQTVITYYAEESGQVMCICPEHMDQMVSVSLERHKNELSKGHPFWYLTEDEDPWEDIE